MLDGPWDSPRAADEAAEQEAILAEEIAASTFGPPPDEPRTDPDCGPPEEAGAWLGEPAAPARDAIPDARPAADATANREAPEPFPFGVIGHDGQGPGGPGFGSGTTLDGLGPGPVLAAELDTASLAGWRGYGRVRWRPGAAVTLAKSPVTGYPSPCTTS